MTEDRYEIKGKIGQGGVGAVYKAYDTQLRREVAIKRVLADEEDADNENATTNLLKEATALSSVQHPHICTVYDAGIDSDGPYVVMELINGKTLDKMVERGTLTYEDFREVAIQSQEAMIAAQELNLVHRDLKPSNVMVSWLPSGRFQVKLVDFGLAKFSAKPSLQTIDHGDAVFGSIFFMAPEQFERTPLDQRTDMYSLGALFYYALTGSYPFDGDTAPQVMASHLQHSVRPLQEVRPDLPIWLSEWVMWHISRNMEHRPASAKVALEKFLADEANAAQGGYGATQQLMTPAARPTSGPQLVVPATGPQAVQPAGHITGPQAITPASTQAVSPATGPQPILSPSGVPNQTTSPHSIRPAGIQPGSSPSTGTGLGAQQSPHTPHLADQAGVAALPTPEKKGLSRTSIIVIVAVLVTGIIIASIVIFSKRSEQKDTETYNRLMKNVSEKYDAYQKAKTIEERDKITLPVTKEELSVLLGGLTGNTKTKDTQGALLAIKFVESAAGDFDIDKVIVDFVTNPKTNLTKERRKEIFRFTSYRKPVNIDTHIALLDYALAHPESPAGKQAVKQVGKVGDASVIDILLKINDKSTSISAKNLFEQAVREILANNSASKKRIAQKLIEKYKHLGTSEVNKLSLLRVLGATGTQESYDILIPALEGDDEKLQISAARSLGSWSTSKPISPMIDAYTGATGNLSRELNKSLLEMLKNQTLSDADAKKFWTRFLAAAPEKHKKPIIGSIGRKDTPWAREIFTNILGKPQTDDSTKDFISGKLEDWNAAKEDNE